MTLKEFSKTITAGLASNELFPDQCCSFFLSPTYYTNYYECIGKKRQEILINYDALKIALFPIKEIR